MPSPTAFNSPALTLWRDHAGWVDIEGDEFGFRFRWVGAWLAAHWNVATGFRDPAELGAARGPSLRADLARASALKAPVFMLRPPLPAPDETQYSELILPLSSDGGTIDVLLVAIYALPKLH
jgi:hypothetical protein